jgi:hypothetical protein
LKYNQCKEFVRKCEKFSGERLTDDDELMLMKQNKKESDIWDIIKRFQKKKWFYELIYKNGVVPSSVNIQDKNPNELMKSIQLLLEKNMEKKYEQQKLGPRNHLIDRIRWKIER